MDAINHRKESRIVKLRPNKRVIIGKRFVLLFITALAIWMPIELMARASTRRGLDAVRGVDEEAQKTAGEAFKNIQVLKNIPADQLLPSMRYMVAVLGVGCDYCHEHEHFDNDDKPTKQRARNMMKMMFAINSDNFNGTREVTCFTCHRGAAKAASMATLPVAAVSGTATNGSAPQPEKMAAPSTDSGGAASASLPTFDQILTNYEKAINVTPAVKRATRVEQGTVDGPRGHGTMETYRTFSDSALAILHVANGTTTEGYDGKIGWTQRAGGEASEQRGDELMRTRQWAGFYPGETFKTDYARTEVRAKESVNGRDAYVVMGWWNEGGADRIYFDAETGLLLRVTHRIESPLGALPLQTDYDDYRDVNGLKIPFTVRVMRVDGTTMYSWQKMDTNVLIDPSRYEKPPEKAMEKTAERKQEKQKP